MTVPRLEPFYAAMAELEEMGNVLLGFQAAVRLINAGFEGVSDAFTEAFITAPARRSAMRAAYRAKTRRRNRR
jgi:hypothetical protein